VRTRHRKPVLLLAALCVGLLLSGCAEFDETAAEQSWQPAPALTPEVGPQPQLPEASGNGAAPSAPNASRTPVPPPDGCKDYDPAVVATCLDTVSAVAALPGAASSAAGLAGERRSGTIYRVAQKQEKKELITLEVEATGDGGLTGLALSPTYGEDQLVFAYITTATDNRVVRFASDQKAEPVLTGIPKGPTGNRGAIISDGNGALLVATGNAGDPAAAADPKSLAGKVLRIDTSGEAAAGNPDAGSRIVASGLHAPGGLCTSADGSRVWVTDQAPRSDAVYRLEFGNPLTAPAWTWPDKPGVAGCADLGATLLVAASKAGNLQNLPLAQDGSVQGTPQVSLDGENGAGYGRLSGMDTIDGQAALVGTVNKDGGDPVSSDDRVAVIVPLVGGPGGGRD
jgi:glucose/arabinose dehydrogenase